MQFSVRDILLGTTAVATACAALMFANAMWAHTLFVFAVVLLLSAILLAYSSQNSIRAYWIGFALFGWAYWLILHSPLFAIAPDTANWELHSQSPFITSRILDWLYSFALPLVHLAPTQSSAGAPLPSTYPEARAFARVGHTIFAMLFAVLGGELGRRAYLAYNPREPRDT